MLIARLVEVAILLLVQVIYSTLKTHMYYHPIVDIKVKNAHKTDGCLISGSFYDTCKTVRLLREMRADVTLCMLDV